MIPQQTRLYAEVTTKDGDHFVALVVGWHPLPEESPSPAEPRFMPVYVPLYRGCVAADTAASSDTVRFHLRRKDVA